MRIQDIMSTQVKTIASNASIAEARSLMKAEAIHHLLVHDQGAVVGVVSDRDLGGRVGFRGADGEARTVAEIMSRPVVTAPPNTTIRQAANLLRGRTIGCLAVMDRQRPIGIVTTTDLLELIGRGVERPIERSTRWTLRSRGVRGAGPGARHARSG